MESLYRGHRFPPEIISHAVWLYPRFTQRFRDVEELLAERGILVSYESIRYWCQKFGPSFPRKLRTTQGKAHYSRRKAIVEPVFGWIKEAVGFRRFSLRSLEKVSAEWDLVCTAINLKHLNATVCWL